MHQGNHDRRTERTLRNDHCGRREQYAERAQHSRSRQQQIYHQADDDRGQAKERVDEHDCRPSAWKTIDGKRRTQWCADPEGAGAGGETYAERQNDDPAKFGIEPANQPKSGVERHGKVVHSASLARVLHSWTPRHWLVLYCGHAIKPPDDIHLRCRHFRLGERSFAAATDEGGQRCHAHHSSALRR